jgi:cephalosporin hydroxylase
MNLSFDSETSKEIASMNSNLEFKQSSYDWMAEANSLKYSYHFSWLGRPVIQYPQDIVAIQELIWKVKPDLIIETGIAHGGSLILSASILTMIEYQEAVANGTHLDPNNPSRRVLAVDIDIREHNKVEILRSAFASRIEMLEGSSTDPSIVQEIKVRAEQAKVVMVVLDSNHTEAHVYEELKAYADLVTIDSYCVVMDTIVEYLPNDSYPDRPWDKGDNPATAVNRFLSENNSFVVDSDVDAKLGITVAPGGYLRRT